MTVRRVDPEGPHIMACGAVRSALKQLMEECADLSGFEGVSLFWIVQGDGDPAVNHGTCITPERELEIFLILHPFESDPEMMDRCSEICKRHAERDHFASTLEVACAELEEAGENDDADYNCIRIKPIDGGFQFEISGLSTDGSELVVEVPIEVTRS